MIKPKIYAVTIALLLGSLPATASEILTVRDNPQALSNVLFTEASAQFRRRTTVVRGPRGVAVRRATVVRRPAVIARRAAVVRRAGVVTGGGVVVAPVGFARPIVRRGVVVRGPVGVRRAAVVRAPRGAAVRRTTVIRRR
jgi:hypothetical protein